MQVKLSDIRLDSENYSRGDIPPDTCRGLAESLLENGQLTPIVVISHDDGTCTLVSGFRRYIAASIAGWEALRAEEMIPGSEPAVVNLLENLERKDLTYWDEILAMKRMNASEKSQGHWQRVLCKGRRWVRARIGIWDLGDDVLKRVERGELTESDIDILISTNEEDRENKLEQLVDEQVAGVPAHKRGGRKTRRSKLELNRMMTRLFDAGRQDWVNLMLYSLGEIEDDELFSRLDPGGELRLGDGQRKTRTPSG